jgi:hypothetical protein
MVFLPGREKLENEVIDRLLSETAAQAPESADGRLGLQARYGPSR